MYNKIIESTKYIRSKINRAPKIAIILGSGLGDLVNEVRDVESISYKDIPNFPISTVKGHEGKLVFGKINDIEVLLMQGRFHYYEGYTMKEVTYPIYVMKKLGIEKIIVTNACGGINKSFEPGTLMLINDFINLFGDNPLIGINDDRLGPRFPDMSEPYKLELIEKAKEVGDKLGIKYAEGVYAGFMGPYYETAAEIVMIGRHGADAVGMSTVPETIVANYLGMDVLGIACITNMATGIQKVKHSHDRVVETAKKVSVDLCRWVSEIIKEI
ncbi:MULTISPECIES: purine-nucleoside phosphorylase [Clostridium]|uniref:Purine nucleoside phosphorylase n=1 Tax=Clostridium beijerinckii TaxID=1520 RepID=A0A1S9NCR4_CLOBE|nr:MULTISPECIES: purine-nucleoside phosphorylase [Clostridium]MBN7574226.1 purine-nucleoside phosphorylase [Clostridium beijerinckii]MBN7579282.1 purine-nucleoside phosphorylase [Clostridium beijerinckii]MBN7583976.1 purine-nucleoside phosphorylase [Clostridium beijerinckii]MBO0519454.1 purine-nucleoside phosphorylase [Clostridium beijerinckii]MZK51624.1 purine-nucleoside phosphorylase [Clostridium beijerinckii]